MIRWANIIAFLMALGALFGAKFTIYPPEANSSNPSIGSSSR